MNLSSEIARLQELHSTGALTDDEFSSAKAAVLSAKTSESVSGEIRSGRDWQRKTFSTITGIVLVLSVISGAYYVLYGRVSAFKVETTTKLNALVFHDDKVLLTYQGRYELTDVHLTLYLYTDDGSFPTQKYWSVWKPGDSKSVDVGVDRIVEGQKIVISGRASKNHLPVWLHCSFMPKKPQHK